MADAIVIFFDIGDTLAAPRFGASGKLEGLDVFPLVTDVLKRLQTTTGPGGESLRLGVISNTGSETGATMKKLLTDAGLLAFFEESLLVFSSVEGVDKTTRTIFDHARQHAGVPSGRCVFVGEDERERNVAVSAGFHVSFHALHVFQVIKLMKP